MSSRTFNRKQFLVFTASTAAASALIACGEDDPGTGGGSSGSGGSGTAGSSGGGAGGSASGSSGAGTAGSSSGSGGATAGSGGSSGGSGGATAGSGGSTAGSGGSTAGSGGSGGSGGGMCGTASITQTSDEMHDHVPQDPAALKMELKTFINMATAASEFTVPLDGQNGGHPHKFSLTMEQIATLKGGGMVTGVETKEDDTNHTHVYTISCVA